MSEKAAGTKVPEQMVTLGLQRCWRSRSSCTEREWEGRETERQGDNKRREEALASGAPLVVLQTEGFTGLISCQGACLGCRFGPRLGCI